MAASPGLVEAARCGHARWWLRHLVATLAPALLLVPATATVSTTAAPRDSADEVALSQLGLQRWDRESGLAGNWVRDIVEGPEGFIWIATSGGLSRFDGRSFVTFNRANTAQLPSSSITALALGAEGALWVGLDTGGVWTLRSGRLTPALPEGVLPAAATVTGLVAEADGGLWVGTDQGLWQLRDGHLKAMTPSPAAPPAIVMALEPSRDGGVWVRTARQGIWWARSGSVERLPDVAGCDGYGLAQGRSRSLYTSCTAGIWKTRGETRSWTLVSPVTGAGPIFVDSQERLWYGTEGGLTRQVGDKDEVLAPKQGLGDWRIRAWFEDSRGDLWVGTFSAGLARLRRGAVTSYARAEGLPLEDSTAVLAQPDGSIWLGSYEDGLVRWNPRHGLQGRWTSAEGLPSDRVWSLAADPRRPERVWVGTERGLAAIEHDQVVRPVTGQPAIDEPVRLIYADPADRGSLWYASNAGGLGELRDGRHFVHGPAEGLLLNHIRFLVRDHRGRLLAGGDRGLFRLEGESWLPELPEPMPSELRAAFVEEDGTLWIASDIEGLIQSTSEGARSFGPREGLPFLPIFSIEADARGGLWLSSNEGLLRFAVREHRRWREGLLQALPLEMVSRREGLRDAECNGWGRPSSTRLPDGRLLYPTISGAALVDPKALPEVHLESGQVQVLSGWAGVRTLDLLEPVRLKPQERSLRLGFTAIDMLRPEAVIFRYRLEGYDTDWTPAGPAREASYSHLSPGTFRFRVQARLPGREWVESSRALPVAVEPTPWETTWLRALLATVAVGLLAAAVSWRLRKEEALRASHAEARELSVKLLRAQEEERERLAREIHDDLTQRLAGLAMLAGRAAHESAGENPDRARRLEDLNRELERLASDAQALSRGLHPQILDALGLEEALRSECAGFSSRTGLEVAFTSSGLTTAPPSKTALGLFRITQEGLRNSLAHSGATAVRVSLEERPSALVLEVADDGVGFDSRAVLAHPGLGLSSMAQRARLIGATLDIDASPGRGTRIVVRVPLAAAGP